jgi:hypothetical protein
MLVTQEAIEKRLGRTLNEAEESQLEPLIGDVTAYITTYTGCAFVKEERTKVLRAQRGQIDLPDRPILSITSVKAIGRDGTPGAATQDFAFDGLSKIRLFWCGYSVNGPDWSVHGSNPFHTYQVVYESGYETVPDDITSIAENAVLNAFAGLSLIAPGVSGVTRLAVGDTSYGFGNSGAGRVAAWISDDDRGILNRYRGGNAYTSFYET